MPDADKILEAEQSIQNIAAELTRMRDAANLLQGAQAKSDAVIAAAQRVVQTTERFSDECGAIVAKLASTDLSQKLDSLQKLHGEVAGAKSDLADQLKNLETEHVKATKGAKTRSIVIMVFAILGFLAAAAALVALLIQRGQ